jgi:S-DNA-T family DNA segregation ATPase FtsK/SpoIIIE
MDRKLKYFFVIAFFALAAFLAVAFVTAWPEDWPFPGGGSWRAVRNLSGPIGSAAAFACFGLMGKLFAWFFPLSLAVAAGGIASRRGKSAGRLVLKTAIVAVLLNALFARMVLTRDSEVWSGLVGRELIGGLTAVLGRFGGPIVVVACLLLILWKEVRFLARHGEATAKKTPFTWRSVGNALRTAVKFAAGLVARVFGMFWSGVRSFAASIAAARRSKGSESDDPSLTVAAQRSAGEGARRVRAETTPAPGRRKPAPELEHAPEPEPARSAVPRATARRAAEKPVPPSPEKTIPIEQAVLPSLSILRAGGEARPGPSSEKTKGWSDVLEGKLANYGIEGHVTAVNHGPQVTTFEFEPAPGVKIRDIVSRSDDLALAMKALSLRLIAPIPGRSVVGIEIPNPDQEVVYLYDVLKEIPDRLRLSGLMFALGVDVSGHPFYMNLCSAPHLLMAGTTGSGKSVSLNCLLASILFQYRPDDVRLLLVDPKMVEMSAYNGIPHLLHPVITDPRDAVRVFTYLITEMGRRNELFRGDGVKNIESYNSKIALGKTVGDGGDGKPRVKLPYIVLVVDELGDLVLTKGADIEGLLSRLSNMARAVGIHMIVATQRPSVDVIVGKTKANFPTRIAFRVASKVDSRTILDCVGAEKLLGKGDLLLTDAKHPEPLRLHGAWISEDELERLIGHWKQYQFEESHIDLSADRPGLMEGGETDPRFDEAREIIVRYNQGSTSLLQRKLQIGYARAARLLDQLEQAGIVGPPDGSKPREVLVKDEAEVAYPPDEESA